MPHLLTSLPPSWPDGCSNPPTLDGRASWRPPERFRCPIATHSPPWSNCSERTPGYGCGGAARMTGGLIGSAVRARPDLFRQGGDPPFAGSSSRETATYSPVSKIRLPDASDLLPPTFARSLLQGVRESELSRLPARQIAGIDAPGLRLTPEERATTVGRVDIWADPGSGLRAAGGVVRPRRGAPGTDHDASPAQTRSAPGCEHGFHPGRRRTGQL